MGFLFYFAILCVVRVGTSARFGIQIPESTEAPAQVDCEVNMSVMECTKNFCELDSIPVGYCLEVQDYISKQLYNVSYTPSLPTSTVSDISMTRLSFISSLQAKFKMRKLLQIGCSEDSGFDKIASLFDGVAHCVDPHPVGVLATHKVSAQSYLAANRQFFNIIIIDGVKHAEHVLRDLSPSLKWLALDGVLIVPDCNPRNPRQQTRLNNAKSNHWTGDIWKAMALLRVVPDVDSYVGDFDNGIGVVFSRPNTDLLSTPTGQYLSDLFNGEGLPVYLEFLKYDLLEKSRVEILRLKSYNEIEALF